MNRHCWDLAVRYVELMAKLEVYMILGRPESELDKIEAEASGVIGQIDCESTLLGLISNRY